MERPMDPQFLRLVASQRDALTAGEAIGAAGAAAADLAIFRRPPIATLPHAAQAITEAVTELEAALERVRSLNESLLLAEVCHAAWQRLDVLEFNAYAKADAFSGRQE